ncbi:hypothetical protein [Micromonospora sp. WMMD980]|nr:hypothetical protein [Micromonospora sp. WMMD980]MDG4802729.1 hypothetical protein [Micromonospora sp. WMMD980]
MTVPSHGYPTATEPADDLPVMAPGRVGNLTPAQTFRANGGRW